MHVPAYYSYFLMDNLLSNKPIWLLVYLFIMIQ